MTLALSQNQRTVKQIKVEVQASAAVSLLLAVLAATACRHHRLRAGDQTTRFAHNWTPGTPQYWFVTRKVSPTFETRSVRFRPMPPTFETRSVRFRPMPPTFETRSVRFRPMPPTFETRSVRFRPMPPTFETRSVRFRPMPPTFETRSVRFRPKYLV